MDKKLLIGWKEWCALPELSIPAIKVKVDTGAKTSALHAHSIELVKKRGKPFVEFIVPALPKKYNIEKYCCVPFYDRRTITSSNGEKETRYVIMTEFEIAGRVIDIELTLTDRSELQFPMLLGREALQQFAFIDPSAKYRQGKLSLRDAVKLY
jgi:ribosomal protein S6--L-glutamate ligase